MHQNFKYEIAFSFCQEDEKLALEIDDYLNDSVKTFIYSQKQKELVGKDGEIEFKRIFLEHSRVVVVLYREKYGNTNWTRIEEDSIRSRAYDDGYDFTLFISLDGKIPKYLPKTRIWYDIERFGTKAAANIISFFINERGGESREINAKDKAEKLGRKLKFKSKLDKYRDSHEAIGNALMEIDNVIKIGESKIREVFDGLNYGFTQEPRKYFKLVYENFVLVVQWRSTFNNSMDKSNLKVCFYKNSYNQVLLKQYEYDFYKNQNWENIWKLRVNDDVIYKSEYFVEKHLKELMDFIEQDKFKNNNSKSRAIIL